MHTHRLAEALTEEGHQVDVISIPYKWYPPAELVHQMALWRSLDLSEAGGMAIDMVICLRFPGYLVRHERKVVWLIHQHRTAYELWEHPAFADLSNHEEGPAVREMVHHADRLALGEAKRIFTNSGNVRDRLRSSLGIESDPLYHRSRLCETLIHAEPGPYGDYVLFPSRLEPIKRQTLAIEAMRHVRSPVRLVLAGSGPEADALRRRVEDLDVGDRVQLAGRVPDEGLIELYRGALAVYYGPFDEDFGYVTLEAMAACRPVVATADSGGPLEFVRDGVNGLVVAPKARAVAGAFDRLYANRQGLAGMGAAGRATVEEHVPEWAEVVARLLS
jgi:glycosyltransferase involved in cell wall biosynthesis